MLRGSYKVKSIVEKGDKYGKLTAVKFSHRKRTSQYWLFKCDCGNNKVIFVNSVKSGYTKSCGCLSKEKNGNFRHGMSSTKIYESWCSMKKRCYNKKDKYYKDYGGRGIKVCSEWKNDFECFYRDMGDKPKNKTLDRIDNDKGYCKGNCHWATMEEQANNRRNNHLITYNNKTQNIKQWAEELEMDRYVLSWRLRNSWSIKDTLEIRKLK